MNKKLQLVMVLCLLAVLHTSVYAQSALATISGSVREAGSKVPLPYANVVLKTARDSTFVTGTITADDGSYSLSNIKPADYFIEITMIGCKPQRRPIYLGALIQYFDLGTAYLESNVSKLKEIEVKATVDEVKSTLDKKSYAVENNIAQSGGSVLQAMQNLPGVTVQEGKVQLRGNDKVIVLIDGKQTALTGFGNQSGLDNIPSSAIEKIEIINNPSAKYEANGNGGIINIIYKKNKREGFSGKVGLALGLGALWIKQQNYPSVRPQYQATPKVNPTLSLNYKKNKVNLFLQLDNLYTQTLNKNEYVTRSYSDGTIIKQQLKRNRNTNFFTAKAGIDYSISSRNTLSLSGLVGFEKILDRGDQPFFNNDLTVRNRLWQFLEDELKTTGMALVSYQHRFRQAGHLFNTAASYSYHREDEKYFFENTLPTYAGRDSFKLISTEQVLDLTADYIKPLRWGHLEVGAKLRYRDIPTDMKFLPGVNSPLDTNAGGWAVYREVVPAMYATYLYEDKRLEAEIGLRAEYVGIDYAVNPNHNTYKSGGYQYIQPFPNVRLGYKINAKNKLSAFYNRRVDRPNEVDIRIFPKYDDAEIIKVGNPSLRPQFTNRFELGYKTTWRNGYLYSAAYYQFTDGTITRLSVTVPSSTTIYAIFQNVNRSTNTGLELIINQDITKWWSATLNANGYYNRIEKFSVTNLYPTVNTLSAEMQDAISGNIKWNNLFKLPRGFEAQLTAIYLAPNIIPQGKIYSQFSLDIGLKKLIQKGKGELFINATDLTNTMNIRKVITGKDFVYTSRDYLETQVIRIGYSYKF